MHSDDRVGTRTRVPGTPVPGYLRTRVQYPDTRAIPPVLSHASLHNPHSCVIKARASLALAWAGPELRDNSDNTLIMSLFSFYVSFFLSYGTLN